MENRVAMKIKVTNKKLLIGVAALLVIIATITIIFIERNGYREQYKKATRLISDIEDFRTLHHRLPKDISELGITENLEGQIFYKQVSNESYLVWFGTTLGESRTYDSRTKKWTDY